MVKALPAILLVSVLLLSIVLTVLAQFSSFFKSEQESKFKVAVVGNTNSRFFSLGIASLKTFDASRFSIDIELTDEDEAKRQLLRGEISAYIVMPKNFIKYASEGKIIPVRYYTTASTIDISGLMRDEITNVVSVLLKETQKGIFGEEQLLIENGYADISDEETDELCIRYIDFIVDRNKMYKTEISGVSYGLDLLQHLMIGHTIIFLCVLTIPFSVLFIRRDNGLIKMLSASGRGPLYSVVAEYAAMLISLLLTLILSALVLLAGNRFLHFDPLPMSDMDPVDMGIALLPVIMMIVAFALAIEELSGNILANVTGFFFLSMGLCYISGCMYPLYALPPILQKAAAFTPTGVCRGFLSLTVTGESAGRQLTAILLYTLLFLSVAVLTRTYKSARGDGA